MTPTAELRTRLRKLLDERIPDGGSSDDTRFSDEDLDELLEDASTMYGAASVGWTMKAGMYQREMADIEETGAGEERYRLTPLKARMEYAINMSALYAQKDKGITGGSRIMKVTAPEVL